MGRRGKFSPEEKILAVRNHLDGKESINSIAKRLNVHFSTVDQWVHSYVAMGSNAFNTSKNNHYSKALKEQAVHDHNYAETAEKYKVSYQQARSYTVKYDSQISPLYHKKSFLSSRRNRTFLLCPFPAGPR